MVTLEQCLEYEKAGWVNSHVSPDGKLIGFKYSLQTTYAHHWDEVTLTCRGIVFERSTGKIIAHPFDKFFNYQEIYAQDGSLAEVGKILSNTVGWEPILEDRATVSIAEKVDGSLGIMYFYDDDWHVKTGGSFVSDQAIWADKWMHDHMNLNWLNDMHAYTFCFEIVSKIDPHVVHYDTEELVLIGLFDENHKEITQEHLEEIAKLIGVRSSIQYYFNSIQEAVNEVSKMDVNHEGVVVTIRSFNTNRIFKMKIKSEEYLDMFHRMSCITLKEIRDHFDEEKGIVDSEYVANIPEELVDMKNYAKTIDTKVADYFTHVVDYAKVGLPLSGRERYEAVSSIAGNMTGATMNYIKTLEGKGKIQMVYHAIWMVVKNEVKKDNEE